MPAAGKEITHDRVRNLGKTAQIALTDEEVSVLQTELSAIAAQVDSLSKIAELDITPTVRPFARTNVLRKDEAKDVLTREEALQNAPEAEAGMFKVSSILGGEQ